MIQNKLITLLSDFGDKDVYVGVLKGVIVGINPQSAIIDLTHQIPRQNISAARFCLLNACSYFPSDTVHIAVVDPGVGSKRRGIAIASNHGYFVGPDNGLFSGILEHFSPIAAVELTNPQYWLTPHPSNTFHGRDIFAPVGAYLASGVSLENLGTSIPLESLIELASKKVEIFGETIEGVIQYIDIFGNLISNIPGNLVEGKNWYVSMEDRIITKGKTYSDVALEEAIALIGSHGWLEIAVNGGNAQTLLNIQQGDPIIIKIK